MKEFEAEMLEVLAGSNLSQHAIEHFAGKVTARMALNPKP